MNLYIIRSVSACLLALFAANTYAAPAAERCNKELHAWTSLLGDVELWHKNSRAVRDAVHTAGVSKTKSGKIYDVSTDTHFVTLNGHSDGFISTFSGLFIDGGTLPYTLSFHISRACISVEGLIKAINTALPKADYEPNAETPLGRQRHWYINSTDKNEENDILIRLSIETKAQKTMIVEVLANEMMLEGLGSE